MLLNGCKEPSTIRDPYNIEDHISSRDNHENEVIGKIEVDSWLRSKCANPTLCRFEVKSRRISLVFHISRTSVQQILVLGVMSSTDTMNLFTINEREGILYMDPLNGKANNNIECYVKVL